MWFSEPAVKIWLYTEPTDMRKSYTGLSALVRQKLKENPLSGNYFIFINRKKTQTKILYFDRSGYCIWSKRLEQGQFNTGKTSQDKLQSKVLAMDETPISPRAATALVSEFLKMGIVIERTGFKRNREFVFEQYLNLF